MKTVDDFAREKRKQREYERAHRPCTPRRFTFGLLKKHVWGYPEGNSPDFWSRRVCTCCGKVERQYISHL